VELIAPGAKVEIVVIFVPFSVTQLMVFMDCVPLFATTTPVEATLIMSIYVDAHFVTSTEEFSTCAVLVLVKLLNQTLNIPPTATVKAMSRTVAIIALIPFISIL
jgi:hypothetical protein